MNEDIQRPLIKKYSVYICGAHSVGKTTLQTALLQDSEFESYEFKGQDEVAREMVEQKGYTQAMLRDPESCLQLQRGIVDVQLARERSELSDFGCQFSRFLWDRGVIDPIIYAKLFCDEKKAEAMLDLPHVAAALTRLQRAHDTLVFVLYPEKALVDFDGVRMEVDWQGVLELHETMIKTLDELQIPFHVIEVLNLPERVELVKKEIKRKWPWMTPDYMEDHCVSRTVNQ